MSKFEAFWGLIEASNYDFSTKGVKEFIEQSLKDAGFIDEEVDDIEDGDYVEEVSTSTKKKLSGYNLFTKDTFAKAKLNNDKIQIGSVGALWKGLSDEEREVYKQKAKKLSAGAPSGKKKGISGYNLYTKETFAAARGKGIKTDIKTVAGQWKGLSDEKKEKFNTRAKAMK